MATAYDNLPLPSANEYPYNLQGDQTKARALAAAAQAGDGGALERLRTLGLDNNANLMAFQAPASDSTSPLPTLSPTPPLPPLPPNRPPTPSPNPPLPPVPPTPPTTPSQTPFTDPRLELQRQRLELDQAKFNDAKARYQAQQEAAAARLQSQQQQTNVRPGHQSSSITHSSTDSMKPQPKPSGGGGGQKKPTNQKPPAPKQPKGRGGGGGGGGGGGAKYAKSPEQQAREKARYENTKNRLDRRNAAREERRDQEAAAKEKGFSGLRAMQDQEARDKFFDESREKRSKDNANKDKGKGNSTNNQGGSQDAVGAGALWNLYADLMGDIQANSERSRPKMVNAYGNKHAKMVKARGDLAN